MNLSKRVAALAVVGTAVLGGGVASASAVPGPSACTYDIHGHPGISSYTLHATDTCDNQSIFRAIITHEDFDGKLHTDVGGWISNGTSVAKFPAIDTVVCYGYQHEYQAHGYTIWFNC